MSKKVLVIGRRPGNIADKAVMRMIHDGWEVFMPYWKALDVTNEDHIENYIAEFGPFDVVLYAAAVNNLQWIKDINMDDLVNTYKVNVFGFVLVARHHVRLFPDHHTRFVPIVSDASHTAMRGSLLYGSSKTALTGVIKNMARELAPIQTVVGVSPTVVEDTPMTQYIDSAVPTFRGWTHEQTVGYSVSGIPIGRRLHKDEVVDTLMFAITGPVGLTGSIIEITGGK
jgi:NAD(P)-dependent dehydrogenase (short-subunit alcohol dehydrogenase family)